MSALRRFLEVNRRASRRLQKLLPQSRMDVFAEYESVVGRHLRALSVGSVVVDVGGGKQCPFAVHRQPGTRIVAVDISENEMRDNVDVDEKLVADITEHLPFPDSTVDVIASRSVLEHLHDVPKFVRESHRVLRPGGTCIHLLPCRFAPFAVINRLLPHRLAKRVVGTLHPGTEGICGFRAFYDHCHFSAMRRVLVRSGFRVEHLVCSYSQSHYFDFVLPMFVVSAAYEVMLWCLRRRDLAAYMLLVAVKENR